MKITRHPVATAVAISFIAATVATSAMADTKAVADFYRGKTVTVHFGGGMGGSYWLYSQLAASHLGKHIPGNPTLVIQSMPGAGGLKGLNYSYNAAPKDGSFITLAHAEVLQETILNPQSKFNAKDYQWVGRLTDIVSLAVASKKSGVKTLDDARKRQVIVGATGLRSWTGFAPMLFNRVADTKFRIVAGYKGADEMFHAMEKNEIEVAPVSWVVVKVRQAAALKSGDIVPLFVIALDRMNEFPNTPTITEFGRNDGEKLFLQVFAGNGMIGRALATPPGVPAERVQALRNAFDKMIADPAFLAYTREKNIDLNPLKGAALAARINKVMDMKPEQVERTRKVYAEMLEAIKDKK